MTRSVPFFDYKKAFLKDEEALADITRDVIRRGAFILQRDLFDLEESLAERTGARYAVGVGNATDGLFMLCRAAGFREGDEVLISSHTMIATAAGIRFTGAIPVPCEVGKDHQLDPVDAERRITARTRAIMPTQLNGRCADMESLQAVCKRHKLLLLEDSAQALGASYGHRYAGTFGLGGVISFYPAKTLGCLGDGGCVLTNDDAVHERLLRYRDFGRDARGEVICWALNSRLDNLQAAFLAHRLKKYDRMVARRREIAARYRERLSDLDSVVLPPGPSQESGRFDIFQNYEIEADHRDDLRSFLEKRGVGTLLPWGGKPVHLHRHLGFAQSLPFTERLFETVLLLPMNAFLENDDVAFVCDQIRAFYQA